MQLNKEEMVINNDSLLEDIQCAFTSSYPFLKIEFLKAGKVAKTLGSKNTSLKYFANIEGQLKLNISNQRTVFQVSDDFKNTLGVIVQLSRKSGKVWNVISLTDGWTLESQNSAGELISSIMDVSEIKP